MTRLHAEGFGREEGKSQAWNPVLRNRRGREDHVMKRGDSTWHGTALILEAVLLLLFVTISLGVVVSMLAQSHSMGSKANQTTYAVALASTEARNGAEAFAAHPTKVPKTTYYQVEDGVFVEADQYLSGTYVVSCIVSPEKREGGTLYRAVIEVRCYNSMVYTLRTASYVSKGRG